MSLSCSKNTEYLPYDVEARLKYCPDNVAAHFCCDRLPKGQDRFITPKRGKAELLVVVRIIDGRFGQHSNCGLRCYTASIRKIQLYKHASSRPALDGTATYCGSSSEGSI